MITVLDFNTCGDLPLLIATAIWARNGRHWLKTNGMPVRRLHELVRFKALPLAGSCRALDQARPQAARPHGRSMGLDVQRNYDSVAA